MSIALNNPLETEAIAKITGQKAQTSDVIALTGGLGASKTATTKGIALGLGIFQMIKSPACTIIRECLQGRFPLYYMDVYRAEEGVDKLGSDEYFEGDRLSIVGWGSLIEKGSSEDYLEITLNKGSQEADKRVLEFRETGSLAGGRVTEILKTREACEYD